MNKSESSYLETGQQAAKGAEPQPTEQISADEVSASSEPVEGQTELPDVSAEIATVPVVPAETNVVIAEEPASTLESDIHPPLAVLPTPERFQVNQFYPRPNQNYLGRILLPILGVALVAGLLFAGIMGALGTQSSNESYFLIPKAQQKIVISDDYGNVTIHSQLNGPFGFQVKKYSAGLGLGTIGTDVTYHEIANIIGVDARVQPNFLFTGTRGVDIDVTVPATTHIEVYCTSGTITLIDVHGQIVAETDTGSIKAEQSSGNLSLKATTGSVFAHNVTGQLVTSTEQGDINMHKVQLSGQSSAITDSGTINFGGTLDRHGNYRFVTGQGPINLSLPANSAFRLLAENRSGPIKNDFGDSSSGQKPQAIIHVSTQHDVITIRSTR